MSGYQPTQNLKEMRSALNARLLLLFVGIMTIFNGVTSTGRTGLSWLSLKNMVESYEAPVEPGTEAVAEAAEDAEDGRIESEAAVALAEALTEEEVGSDSVAEKESDAQEAIAAAEQETELNIGSLIEQMDQIGITTGDLGRLGIVTLITAVAEILVGLLCTILSNRVDKWKITLTGVCVLLGVEVLYILVLFSKGAMAITGLLSALFLPLVLLWAATRMRRLAKADPERKFAVEPQQGGSGLFGGRRNSGPAGGASASNASTQGGDSTPKKSLRDRALMDARDDQDHE